MRSSVGDIASSPNTFRATAGSSTPPRTSGKRSCRRAARRWTEPRTQPTAVGITNQRETAVLWDRETLGAPRNAIVWQDRRTAALCDELREAGHEDLVRARTGLRLDPYFTGTKLTWLATHEPHTWAGVTSGRVAVGTVDSYVIARMTRGLHHVTDPSNASRTLLFDIHAGSWSAELADVLRVPLDALPEVVPSWGAFGRTDPTTFLGLDLPIAGIAGDQQAALFGQTCFEVGASKCTYGTGSFILTNTGATPVASAGGLLTTVAWGAPDGQLTYALEGAVFVTGAAVQWLRDGLEIIASATETEHLARSVPDSGGVVFVPALTGLGAPDWDPTARGLIIGLTRGTTRAHVVRATLEAIAFEVRDVCDLMTGEAAVDLPRLAVDGGAAAERPALRAAGGPARGPCGAPVDPRDDRPGRGVPGRSGDGRVVVHRGAQVHLGARPSLRAGRSPRRGRSPPLAGRRTALEGLGHLAPALPHFCARTNLIPSV